MNVTLKECLLNYVQVKKIYLKESTYVRYSNLIQNHINDEFGNILISDLNNKLIQEYCDNLLVNKISITVIKEIVLLIKLSLKRDAKINNKQVIFIDLDLPIISKKRKVNIVNRLDQKQLINYI